MKEERRHTLTELLTKIGLKEKVDLNKVHIALTHPSYLFEGGIEEEHNQRLEFLGDAVIGLIIAQYLYEKYPHKTEGELTKMRAAVICESSLARGAQRLELGSYLLLGRGEELMGGAKRSSNLADCFEAFIGALYLSLGPKKLKNIVLKTLCEEIMQAEKGKYGDYKTQLQEFIQRNPQNRLSYQIIKEDGPDHEKHFMAAVYLNEEELARGSGNTKKEAEQKAANLALEQLGLCK